MWWRSILRTVFFFSVLRGLGLLLFLVEWLEKLFINRTKVAKLLISSSKVKPEAELNARFFGTLNVAQYCFFLRRSCIPGAVFSKEGVVIRRRALKHFLYITLWCSMLYMFKYLLRVVMWNFMISLKGISIILYSQHDQRRKRLTRSA